MQTLIIKDGVLRQLGNSEEEKKELAKNNWDYRLVTASGQFTVIDYDKDLARPYVKALLAKVNRLREVKMLWGVLILSILTMIGGTFLFTLVLVEIGKINKSLTTINETMSKVVSNNPKKETLPHLPETSTIVQPVEELEIPPK